MSAVTTTVPAAVTVRILPSASTVATVIVQSFVVVAPSSFVPSTTNVSLTVYPVPAAIMCATYVPLL